jgi:hypothetical protein
MSRTPVRRILIGHYGMRYETEPSRLYDRRDFP